MRDGAPQAVGVGVGQTGEIVRNLQNLLLKDDDAEKIARSLEWARAQGKLAEPYLPSETITDAAVEQLMAERAAAKKARDFARSDAIRKQLSDAGIVVEDTKDGIRWKRK